MEKKFLFMIFVVIFIAIVSFISSSFAGWIIETLPLKPPANQFLLGKVEVPPNQNYEKIHVLAYMATYPEGGMLYLAVRDDTSWQVEEVCSPEYLIEEFDIASGEQGVGFVFRESYGEDEVWFGRKDGSQWAFEIIESGPGYPDIGHGIELRADLLGDFHLVYLNEDIEKDT